MKRVVRIDDYDKKILYILQKDAEISLKELSKKVGLKNSTVLMRIRRLKKLGVIKGSGYILDQEKVGIGITAFIGVYIDRPRNIKLFEKNLSRLGDEILECHHVTGEYSLILKVKTKDTETLRDIIERIRETKGVLRTYTMISFETTKESYEVPLKFI